MEYPLLRFFFRSYLSVEPDGDPLRAVSDYHGDRGGKALIELGKEVQELLALPFDEFMKAVEKEELSIEGENPGGMQKLMWDLFEHIRSRTNQKWF